MLNPE